MFGRLIAGLVVVGLAIGVWALWPEGGGDPTTSTVADDPSTTSDTGTILLSSTTTTTVEASNVVETVAEAEAVLRDFWFGWFEGIYLQDEERIKEVVASQNLLDNAREQFGVMEFIEQPTSEALSFSQTEILLKSTDCLVIWSDVAVPFRGGNSTGNHVLRWIDDSWAAVSIWANKDDLWEQDCEAQLEPLQ